jgi:hypothetical protein
MYIYIYKNTHISFLRCIYTRTRTHTYVSCVRARAHTHKHTRSQMHTHPCTKLSTNFPQTNAPSAHPLVPTLPPVTLEVWSRYIPISISISLSLSRARARARSLSCCLSLFSPRIYNYIYTGGILFRSGLLTTLRILSSMRASVSVRVCFCVSVCLCVCVSGYNCDDDENNPEPQIQNPET